MCWLFRYNQCRVSVQCTVYGVRCTVYGVRCTVYGVRCTVYGVRCTVYGVRCTLYTVHCTLYTVHCTLYSVRASTVSPKLIYVHLIYQSCNNAVVKLHGEKLWNAGQLLSMKCVHSQLYEKLAKRSNSMYSINPSWRVRLIDWHSVFML